MATTKASGLRSEPGIRERSPGHFELSAYNPATKRQVYRTYVAPRAEKGAGIRQAKTELARLRTDIAQGKLGGQRATLGYLLEQFIQHSASRGRSPTTLAGYRSNARQVLASPLADKTLTKLTAHDLDSWYAGLRAAGASQATVVHYHRLLRAALNQAERWGWVNRNPAKFATVGGAPRLEMHVPTAEQAQALVERAAKGTSPELGPIILFAILVGCRRGELCGLRWSDVDWTTWRVTFRRSVWEVASKTGLKDTKTHQQRTLALDANGMQLLAARRARAEEDARAADVELGSEAYVWATGADGTAPRTPDSLTRAFAHLCDTMEREARAAGRTETWPFRFHDLRHLSATQMVGSGIDPRTVAARLGHADASVTLRVYAHALEERDRDAAELLGRSLGTWAVPAALAPAAAVPAAHT